jgi:uncharacterized protein (DUF305 family)
LTLTGQALAQHHGHGSHSGHSAATALTPAGKAFAEANAKMHRDMNIPFVGNAEADFVRGMIPHHQGAVEMSEIVVKFGRNANVRALAEAIIKAQRTEITYMKDWLTKNPTPAASSEAVSIKSAYTAVNMKMHKDMMITSTNDADKDFLAGMIPHHEGAVAMAKILQQFGKDAELLKLGANIIQSQNDEISQMRALLAKL